MNWREKFWRWLEGDLFDAINEYDPDEYDDLNDEEDDQ